MSAYTSSQAGNWSSSSTWGGSGVPADGDTATVSHAVTVDTNATVGTSPDNTTTFVIAINSSGSLTISNGVTLTVRGNVSVAPSSVTSGVTINGTGKLYFDGSAIGTSRNYILSCSTNGRLNMAGTDANNRATIDSNPSGGVWLIGRVNIHMQNINWARFNRLGSASVSGMTGLATANAGQTISISNTIFSNSTHYRFSAASATGSVVLSNVTEENPVGSTTHTLTGFAGATCTIDRCVFQRLVTMPVSRAWVVTNTYFGRQLQSTDPGAGVAGGFATGSGDNYYGHLSGNATSFYGTLKDCYYFHNSGDNANYIAADVFSKLPGDEVSGWILDYGDTSPSSPDGIIVRLSSGSDIVFKNNIKLPDPAGTSSGAIGNVFQVPGSVGGTVAFEHNTYCSIGGVTQNAIYFGEDGNGFAGMITGIKSNIAWTPSGQTQGFKAKRHGTNTTQDFVSAANCDYNWGWNLAAGGSGNGYESSGGSMFSSGTPDANGGNGDPGFVDPTRNLVRFDIAFLGNAAATAWADATAYAVGDVRSASHSAYFNGETINWRCITAHTSNAANATNGKPGDVSGFRTNWEPMSLFRLREDPTRITDLITWVREGFQVTNASLNNAGHDGITIGAGDFQNSFQAGWAKGSNSVLSL